MGRKYHSPLTHCSFSAACCLLSVTGLHAEEPRPIIQSDAPVVIFEPQDTAAKVAPQVIQNQIPSTGSVTWKNTYDVCAQPCRTPAASRYFFTADYLMWWFKDSPQPVPLVTATPAEFVDGLKIGSLNDPNASIVLGGRNLDTGIHSGYRLTAGMWMDDHQCLGFEASYFFFTPSSVTQSVGSLGGPNAPLLSVPFFDVTGYTTPNNLPGESARPLPSPAILAFDYPSTAPGQTAGVFTQRLESQLQGFELNTLIGLSSRNDGLRLHAIAGFRYLSLREDYQFATSINALPLGFPDVLFNSVDQFSTRNDFYGGQLGVRGEYTMNKFVFQATAKVALGDMQQQVTVNGATASNLVEGPATPLILYQGGVFAQPSNIGSYSRDVFAVVPQVELNLGYKVSENVRFTLGYSLLYLSNVARPGNEIDRSLNVTRIPFNNDPNGGDLTPSGPNQPSFKFDNSSFWAQGVNFGLEFRF